MKFFVGVFDKRHISWVDKYFMMSYARLKNRKSAINPPSNLEWIMDSSGFSEIHKNGRYTFTTEEYEKSILLHMPNWFANMDWMCEQSALAKSGKTVAEHQELTTENHVILQDWAKENGMGFMGVVQGYAKSDYISHIDSLKERGLICEYIGIGSICRRSQDYNIFNIVNTVKEELPSWVKLHLFGVKNSIFNHKLFTSDLAYSCDSMAWSYLGAMNKSQVGRRCNFFSNIICDKNYKWCNNCEMAFRKWMSKLDFGSKQTRLSLRCPNE